MALKLLRNTGETGDKRHNSTPRVILFSGRCSIEVKNLLLFVDDRNPRLHENVQTAANYVATSFALNLSFSSSWSEIKIKDSVPVLSDENGWLYKSLNSIPKEHTDL